MPLGKAAGLWKYVFTSPREMRKITQKLNVFHSRTVFYCKIISCLHFSIENVQFSLTWWVIDNGCSVLFILTFWPSKIKICQLHATAHFFFFYFDILLVHEIQISGSQLSNLHILIQRVGNFICGSKTSMAFFFSLPLGKFSAEDDR